MLRTGGHRLSETGRRRHGSGAGRVSADAQPAPAKPRISCRIADARWREGVDPRGLARAAVRAALATAPQAGGDVAVLFADDAAIRALNARWRASDKPTNVLSFPAHPASGDLGDIVLAYETVADEAGAEGKSIADHISHLVVHGALHLLGHDHLTDAEAARMEALETALLQGLGVADPYADRTARRVPA